MQVKYLIKLLKKFNPDLVVGMSVRTQEGSEFWALGDKFKVMDGGKTLCLWECRRNKGLATHAKLKNIVWTVDSAPLDYETVKKELDQRFCIEPDSDPGEVTEEEAVNLIFECVHKEIAQLIKLNNDLLLLLNHPDKTRYYWIEQEPRDLTKVVQPKV